MYRAGEASRDEGKSCILYNKFVGYRAFKAKLLYKVQHNCGSRSDEPENVVGNATICTNQARLGQECCRKYNISPLDAAHTHEGC